MYGKRIFGQVKPHCLHKGHNSHASLERRTALARSLATSIISFLLMTLRKILVLFEGAAIIIGLSMFRIDQTASSTNQLAIGVRTSTQDRNDSPLCISTQDRKDSPLGISTQDRKIHPWACSVT